MEVKHYSAKNEFRQNGLIRVYFFYSAKDTEPLHDHDFYEIFYVLNGSAIHNINGQSVAVGVGDITIVRCGDCHSYEPNKDLPFHFVNISFTKQLMEHLKVMFNSSSFFNTILTSTMPQTIHIPMHEREKFSNSILNFCYNLTSNFQNLEILAYKFLFDSFYSLIYSQSTEYNVNGNNLPLWFNKFYKSLDKHDVFTKNLNDIILDTDKSREYVSRTFRKVTNKTLIEYIIEKRMDYAYTLLMYTEMDIINVVFESGFANTSTFYHAFKKQFGITPKMMRKSIHQ